MMENWLHQCRTAFGEPPRRFGFWERYGYLRIPKPKWCTRADLMSQIFRAQKRILRDGLVVWGHLIQANMLLFKPGPMDHPGEVVYCPERLRRVDPDELATVAHRLGSLKGTSPRDENLRSIADYLTNERIRVFGLEVPRSVSPRLRCMISSVQFRRLHLPAQRLRKGLFPIVVLPESPRLAIVLPARYWPEELVAWWSAGK